MYNLPRNDISKDKLGPHAENDPKTPGLPHLALLDKYETELFEIRHNMKQILDKTAKHHNDLVNNVYISKEQQKLINKLPAFIDKIQNLKTQMAVIRFKTSNLKLKAMRIKEVKDKIDFKYEQIYNTAIPIAQVVTSTESIPPTSPNFPVSSSLALSAYTKDSNPSGSDGNNTKTGNQDIHMPSLNNENIITDHKGTGSVPEYLFSTHNSLLFSSPGCTNSSINPGNISTSSPITADEASIEPNVVGSETPVTLTSLNQTKLPLPLISKENDSELPDIEPLRIKTITPSTSLAGANGVASKNIPDTSNKNEHYPSPPLVSSVKIKTKRKPRVLKLD